MSAGKQVQERIGTGVFRVRVEGESTTCIRVNFVCRTCWEAELAVQTLLQLPHCRVAVLQLYAEGARPV